MFFKHIKICWNIFYRLCAVKICSIFPICHNKIVFRSYCGTKYGDSPKYISEALIRLADKKHKQVDIVWIVTPGVTVSGNVRTVQHGTLRSIYELATARVWVDNTRKELWNRKRSGQYYIQTWHSSAALKKVEKDAEGKLSWGYIKAAQLDSKMIDLLISGSRWRTNQYKESFWYSGSIWESGLPRSDIFYQKNSEQLTKQVREFFQILPDEHIAIYAPTFRNDTKFSLSQLDYKRLLSSLKSMWGHNWKLIIRLHPNWSNKQHELFYNAHILNGSNYPEINELLIAADLLITDYSSCMFDAMEAKTPVILYAPDIQEYWKERGCYFQFDQLPFPLATNTNELIQCITNFNFSTQAEKIKNFMKELGFINDGKAARRVASRILEKMK